MSSLTPQKIESYLHEKIPITRAMGVQVVSAQPDRIVVSAALAPNINHKGTAFGGSLDAVCAVACWSMVYFNLVQLPARYEIVLADSQIKYQAPIQADFEVTCLRCDEADWARFSQVLNRKGKARVHLEAYIGDPEQPAVHFAGTFVAIRKGSSKQLG